MSTTDIQKRVADIFARLGRLFSNGVPLLSALEVTSSEMPDSDELKHLLLKTIRYLETGKSFSDSLKEFPLFCESLITAVSSGEQQGTLDEKMIRISDSILKGDFPLGEMPSIESVAGISADAGDNLVKTIPDLLETILETGYRSRASDLHIDPDRDGSRIRFRIDGILQTQQDRLSKEQHKAIASRIKILASLDPAERKLPQDGRFFREYENENGSGKVRVDYRVSVCPFIFGEKIVLRYLCNAAFPDTLNAIMNDDEAAIIRKWLKKPYGMILVTGPTGCGKTTTLYLMLTELAAREGINVMSVEDPVEYLLPNVHQLQINPAVGLTFDNAIRAFLRMDPDVVSVGEIREPETAVLLSKVALTGHVVLSQLHRSDCISTLNLLVDIGVSSYILKQILIGVVAQRLFRKLCPACKQELTSKEHDELPESYRSMNITFYKATGCDECSRIGYKGRMAVYEIFEPQPEFWQQFDHTMPDQQMKEVFASCTRTFQQESLRILKDGLTTWSELDRISAL